MLHVEANDVAIQSSHILRGLTREVGPRELVCMVGRNGAGSGYAPEDGGVFADLTVAENIEMATWTRPQGWPAAERIERAPAIFPSITEGVAAITRLGHGILLVESNIHHVPEFADRLHVIERGEIIFAGKPQDVQRDAAVMRIIGGTV